MTLSFDQEIIFDNSLKELLNERLKVYIKGPYPPYTVAFAIKELKAKNMTIHFDIQQRNQIGFSSKKEELYVEFSSSRIFTKD